MLGECLDSAMSRAQGMVNGLRQKAAQQTPLAQGTVAGAMGQTQTLSMSDATAQYQHNREWVHACVSLIAQRVAGQTIHIGRPNAPAGPTGATQTFMRKDLLPLCVKSIGSNVAPAESHPLLDLLADPYELGTGWTLMYVTVASLELTGRAIWYVDPGHDVVDMSGGHLATVRRAQILPIPVSWIQSVARDRSVWKIRDPMTGDVWDLPGEQVVHFFYPDPADPWGCLSPLGAIAKTVLADESIMDAQWRVFKQGHFPGFAIKIAEQASPGGGKWRPELTEVQRAQLVGSIRRMYQGSYKLGEPFILDGLIDSIEKLTLTPAELGFLDSGKMTKSRILQGYHVNPILLGEVEGANRASATVADEIFVGNKINPLIEMLSQAMTAWLGPIFAGGEKLVVWIEPATPKDAEMASKNWGLALQQGAVTKNEFRRAVLNLPSIEGGDELPDGPTAPAGPLEKTFASIVDPYSLRPM